MPPSKRAVAAWDALNERQRTYMTVFYHADQSAERFWSGAWARGEDAPPASVWRWLEYGNVGGGTLIELGKLQRALQSAGVRDPGAGATLEALEQRKLIETTSEPSMIGYTLKVKLTTFGRAVCRAGGLDPDRPLTPRRGLLSQALWGMLVDVHEAGPEGLESKHANGAWDRLTEREPEPFVDRTLADGGSWGPWLLRLTDAGRTHYAAHWQEYARLYPGVNAPSPDGAPVWPSEVDLELKRLREACWPPAAQLKEIREELVRLDTMSGATQVDVPAGRGELARLAGRRSKAAAAYDAVVARAVERYRAALEEQIAELVELRRQAAIRYAAAATAVVNAVAAGSSPAAVVKKTPPPVSVWPWVPDMPVTGLREVDQRLARAHPMAAVTAPAKKRSRSRAARKGESGQDVQPVEDTGELLIRYAHELETLVTGGKLVRLLMRDRPRT